MSTINSSGYYFSSDQIATDTNKLKKPIGWHFSFSEKKLSDGITQINWFLYPTGAEGLADNTYANTAVRLKFTSGNSLNITQNTYIVNEVSWRQFCFHTNGFVLNDTGTYVRPPSSNTNPPGGINVFNGIFNITHSKDLVGTASFTATLETAVYYKPEVIGGYEGYNFKTSQIICEVTNNPSAWACTSPSCIMNKYISRTNKTVGIEWSGASDGGINKISYYKVYYNIGSDPTSDSSFVEINSSNKFGTSTITLNDISETSSNIYFRMQAIGELDSSGHTSELGASDYSKINSIPNKPTCTYQTFSDANGENFLSNKGSTLPSTGAYVRFFPQVGSDDNKDQSLNTYYSVNSAKKTQYDSNSGLMMQITSSTTVNFYTYDGYDYSQPYQLTFDINDISGLDNGLSLSSSYPNIENDNYKIKFKIKINNIHSIEKSNFIVTLQPKEDNETWGTTIKTISATPYLEQDSYYFDIGDIRQKILPENREVEYKILSIVWNDGIENIIYNKDKNSFDELFTKTYYISPIPKGNGYNYISNENESVMEEFKDYISSVFRYVLENSDLGYDKIYLKISDGITSINTNSFQLVDFQSCTFSNLPISSFNGENLTIIPVLCYGDFTQQLESKSYKKIIPVISKYTTINTGHSDTPYRPLTFNSTEPNSSLTFSFAQLNLLEDYKAHGIIKDQKFYITFSNTNKNIELSRSDIKTTTESVSYTASLSRREIWRVLDKEKNTLDNGFYYEDEVFLSYTDVFGAEHISNKGKFKVSYQAEMKIEEDSILCKPYNDTDKPAVELENYIKENMALYLNTTIISFAEDITVLPVLQYGENKVELEIISLSQSSKINVYDDDDNPLYKYTYTTKELIESKIIFPKIKDQLGENAYKNEQLNGVRSKFYLYLKNKTYNEFQQIKSTIQQKDYIYLRHSQGIAELISGDYNEEEQKLYKISTTFKISDFGIDPIDEKENYLTSCQINLQMSSQNSNSYNKISTYKLTNFSIDEQSCEFKLEDSFTGAQKIRLEIIVTSVLTVKNNLNKVEIPTEKIFYSNSQAIFNTSSFPPTIAYRKNFLGFNIVNPEAGEYNDCIIVFGEAPNPLVDSEEPIMRNKIKYVGTQALYCTIDGFIIEGGSWDKKEENLTSS